MFYQKSLVPANRKLNDEILQTQYQCIAPAASTLAKATKFACKICSTLFQTSESLKNHQLLHNQKDKLFCDICCQYYPNSVKSQNLHILMHKNNICYFCSRGFDKEERLNKHMLDGHSSTVKKPFCCVYCPIKVKSKVSLRMHLKKRHNVIGLKFYCGHCSSQTHPTVYESCERLTLHIAAQHSSSSAECHNNELEKVVDDATMFEEFLDEKFADTCDELLFQQILDNDTAAHNSSANDCKHCSHTFKSEKDLIMHDITEHLPINGYTPDIESDRQSADTQSHASATNTSRYKCPKCTVGGGKVYEKQSQLILHLAHDHDDPVLSCNECGISFKRLNDLMHHRRDHQIDKHLIEVISMLDDPNFDHIEIVEDPKKQQQVIYRCRLCDKTFHRKTAMEQHSCGATTNELSAPPFTADQPNVRCTECPENFKTLSKMDKHRRNTHTCGPNALNVCSLCDKKFQTIGGLKYHLKTHTGSKPFTCPYECALKFTAKVNLNAHIRNVHASVKLYKCNVCERKFTSSDHLRKHIISQHKMLRSYKCTDCDKKFFQQSHLVQHRWIHTGVKPFTCAFCPKTYTSKTSLRKHLDRDHD